MGKRKFKLVHREARDNAIACVIGAPDGYVVTVEEDKRTKDQNAKFHAICGDLAKSDMTWAGKRRNTQQWKVLLVSGHAVAKNEKAEIIPGLEGEFVNIRESTALMGRGRGSSLIEYAIAFCAMNDVRISA